jgi:cell division protein FtsZ
VIIPNDRLLQIIDPRASIKSAFLTADDLLRQGIQGVSDLITGTGLVNVDFNDVRSIMGNGGSALMAIGHGKGEHRAADAANQAVNSQLLDISIDGARGVLFNIKGSANMTLHEVNTAAEIIGRMVDPDANIIFGAAVDQGLSDDIQITVIATGFDSQSRVAAAPAPARAGIPAPARPAMPVAREVPVTDTRPRPRTVEFAPADARGDDWDIPPFLRHKDRKK